MFGERRAGFVRDRDGGCARGERGGWFAEGGGEEAREVLDRSKGFVASDYTNVILEECG